MFCAYTKGFIAFRKHGFDAVNPYASTSDYESWYDWNEGFNDAQNGVE